MIVSSAAATVNGVDLAAIGGLAQQLLAEPDAPKSSWSARTQWTGAFTSASYAREHGPIVSDEPTLLAGSNSAPNPVEYVLAALGSCLAVGYAASAAARGIELRALEIEVAGTIDLRVFLGLAEGHAGYDRIELTTRVDSDADDAALQELHEHVVKTSPVGNTIEHPVELRTRLVKS
jgi:uncharacterized OsmC-like protein